LECTIESQGYKPPDNCRARQNHPRNTLNRTSQTETGSLNIFGNIYNLHETVTLNHNT